MPYREWARRLGASPPKRICCFMVRVPRGSNRIQGCGASFAPNWRALLGSSPSVSTLSARPHWSDLTGESPYKRLPRAGLSAESAKGFGCRLVVTYPSVLRAGVRKPAGKEPAVGGAGGGRLWRFGGGAARASDALGAGVGGRSTIAAGRGFPLLFSTERFRRDGRHSARVRRRWRNGAAAPEAASSGGWSMR